MAQAILKCVATKNNFKLETLNSTITGNKIIAQIDKSEVPESEQDEDSF